MDSLEAELDRARSLSVDDIADAIEEIGFECTDCGACCRAVDSCGDSDTDGRDDRDTDEGRDSAVEEGCDSVNDPDKSSTPHTATVFPDEIRQIQRRAEYDWRDVARPMPYGLDDGSGETFEWAIQTGECGDCTFYDGGNGRGGCTIYEDRPLICRTYPFSVDLGSTSQPMGDPVDREGIIRAHECEGLGRSIDREDAEQLAHTLKRRAVRELEEAIGVRDAYESMSGADADVVVHDSEGTKRPDGTPL